MASTSITKTCSATAPSRAPAMSESGWRIGDHRREVRFCDELALDAGAPGEFADAGAFLDEIHLELEQHSRFDRGAKFRPFDRHEIDELARAGEAERLDSEHAGRLRHLLADE